MYIANRVRALQIEAYGLTGGSRRSRRFHQAVRLRGPLYPSWELFKFVTILENTFTECFSGSTLHHDSVLDLIELLKGRRVAHIGCEEHYQLLTARVMSFYLLARLHFYVKTLNRSGATRRKAAHARKLTRCS